MAGEQDKKTEPSAPETRPATGDPFLDVAAAAGSLVHEIKNPLSTLSINAQLLLEDWKDASTQRERRTVKRAKVMATEVERLERIVQSFLRFTRGHALNRKPSSLNQCLEELAAFIESDTVRKGIEVRLGLDPDLPVFPFDPDLVRQVFLNLVLNAERAMEEKGGGELILRTSRAQRGGASWAVGQVIDTGCGISERARERIFDLYYSTSRDGSGLGLATSKRIAEQHGGFIEVESEEGRGSQFSLFLPLASRGDDGKEAKGGAS